MQGDNPLLRGAYTQVMSEPTKPGKPVKDIKGRPMLHPLSVHMQPTQQLVENWLHFSRNAEATAALARAAWGADETQAAREIQDMTERSWPIYYGQKLAPDFSAINWDKIVAEEREHHIELREAKARFNDQQEMEDLDEALRAMLAVDATMHQCHDLELIEHIIGCMLAQEPGRSMDRLANERIYTPVAQYWELYGDDEDDRFTDHEGGREHVRIGRAVIGVEAATGSLIKGLMHRPRFDVSATVDDAKEFFEELRDELNPVHERDMHGY